MQADATTLRRVAVCLQIAATLGTAFGVIRAIDWPWPLAIAVAVLIYTVIFATIVGFAFIWTFHGIGLKSTQRPNVPINAPKPVALTWRAALKCWLYECVAVWRVFNVLQPFCAMRAWRSPDSYSADRPPLLLIHGYGCHHAVWLDLQAALADGGYRCEGIDLLPLLGDIDDYGRQIAEHAAMLRERDGVAPILVCHSMGGLAARAALRHARNTSQPPPCTHIVTLGTPHQGTVLARYGRGTNAQQMCCRNDWLESLAREESGEERAAITSIFSWHDSIVGPPGTSFLEGARHIALSGLGHVSLLTHRDAHRAVLHALAALAGRANRHA